MMKPTPHKTVVAAAAALAVWLSAAAAPACNVPVFRYALERWQPSYYGVFIFHREPLSPEQKKVVDWLAARGADQDMPCNVDVRAVDVSAKMGEELESLWKGVSDKQLPRLVACFPWRYGQPVAAWDSPLDQASAEALLDSPVRREVARRICAGDSAVWVLVQSGDQAKDAAAAQLLEAELKRLAGELKLPEQEPPPWGADMEGAPDAPARLNVGFSVVPLSRQAPAERAFLEMLLRTEPDLKDPNYAGEPMTFAVFGQGRSLFALVGKGIHKDNIEEVCAFLTGRCSCEIKDMNPGVDLLMTANWEAAFEQGQEAVAAPLPAALGGPPAGADDANAAAVAQVASPAAGGSRDSALLRNTLLAVAVLGAASMGLVIWIVRRMARN